MALSRRKEEEEGYRGEGGSAGGEGGGCYRGEGERGEGKRKAGGRGEGERGGGKRGQEGRGRRSGEGDEAVRKWERVKGREEMRKRLAPRRAFS